MDTDDLSDRLYISARFVTHRALFDRHRNRQEPRIPGASPSLTRSRPIFIGSPASLASILMANLSLILSSMSRVANLWIIVYNNE